MKKWTLTFFLMLIAGVLFAQQQDYGKNKTTNNKELIQVIDNFRMAIINNNAEKASSLLTDDARILETGGIETKEEYLSHHFHSDGKFLSAMERELKTQKVTSSAKTAWISTVSKMSGTYNDQDISIDSAELAVLVKTKDGWKISAVHWSSRSAE
ncbi:MAG: nuclear transport factor 2 family protein [Balneolaceae bacterium]|nr:nuclear transport factor 2 family protein [Balneolaceae bacterium]